MENLSQFPNPLLEQHRRDDAETQPYGRVEIVSTFGEPQAEYAAVHKSAGLMDLPQRGALELTGPDRLSFLNGLLSNVTWDKATRQPIPPGSVVYSFLLNLKGRVVCDMTVVELGDRAVVETDARLVEPVRQVLEQYHFAEKVQFRPLAGVFHALALYGPRAGEALLRAAGGAAQSAATPGRMVSIADVECVAFDDAPTGTAGVELLVPVASVERVYQHLLAANATNEAGKALLRPIGWAAFNACRIEAGRPLFGIDFDGVPPQTAYPSRKAQQEAAAEAQGQGVLPAETGPLFDRAVSLTKCYIGQEVVARMHARQQVARKIVGIRMADDALPIAGAPVLDADRGQVGIVTSSTLSPVQSNAAICLAFVKKPFFDAGSEVSIPAEGQIRSGKVVELPFVVRPPASDV